MKLLNLFESSRYDISEESEKPNIGEIEIILPVSFDPAYIASLVPHATPLRDNIDGYDLYKIHHNDELIIIAWDAKFKCPAAFAGFNHYPDIRKSLWQVKNAETFDNYKGNALTAKIYKYCKETLGMTLQSDIQQSPDAKKLWMKTLPSLGLHPKIYDTHTHKVLDQGEVDVYADSHHRYCWVLEHNDVYRNQLPPHSILQPYNSIYINSRTLSQILSERVSAVPSTSPGASLTIWDIDDTLMHTTAKVMVVDPDGQRRELTASEFNSYELRPGEKYDFEQFQDAKIFYNTSKPIENIWRTAQNTLAKIGKRPGSRMVIITARAEFDNTGLFIKTFEKHGMDMNKVKVYTVAGAKNKKPLIKQLLQTGHYTETRLFDDHPENLKDFLSLSPEFPGIIFKAFPVGHNGKVGNAITLGGKQ